MKIFDDWAYKQTAKKGKFDPRQLNDSVALKTKWTGAKTGGEYIQTHKLVKVNDLRLEYRQLPKFWISKIFWIGVGIVFVAMGIGGVIIAISDFTSLGFGETFGILIMPIVGALVINSAIKDLRQKAKSKIVFDKIEASMWKGKKDPRQVINPKKIKGFLKFDRIYAIQLICQAMRGDRRNFSVY